MDYKTNKEGMRTFFLPKWVQDILELSLSIATPTDEILTKIGKVIKSTAVNEGFEDQLDRDTMKEILSINQNLYGIGSQQTYLMEVRQIIAKNYF